MTHFTKWAGIILFLSWTFHVQAQTIPCANDSIWNNQPDYEVRKKAFADEIQEWKNKHHTQGSYIPIAGDEISSFEPGCVKTRYVVPVVFHIDTTANYITVNDSQVRQQLKILNDAFYSDSIQFVLARKKPDGSTFNGITRFSLPTLDNRIDIQASMLKSKIHYDPNKYLNIYIVKNILNMNGTPLANGYATAPERKDIELVVIAYKRLGDYNNCSGTCDSLSTDSRGRTLVHEVGHYLGLRHIFEGTCSGGVNANTCSVAGDLCCDTRPTTQSETCPITFTNSCPTYPYNNSIPQDHSNYMGYNSDACRNNFTYDQLLLMYGAIEQYRQELVNPVNVKNLDPVHCLTSAWFSLSENLICDSGEITFSAYEYNTGSVIYNWEITDAVSNVTVLDTALSTESMTYFFNTVGKYNVELKITKGGLLGLTRYNVLEVANCGSHIASEQANWVFGKLGAIKFTENGAVRNISPWNAKFPSNIDALESSISQSDASGNMLFYGAASQTRREYYNMVEFEVYNKEYNQMPHSPIIGDYSSAQGASVVEIPFRDERYYVITSCTQDALENSTGFNGMGLRYSTVYTGRDGGRGDLIDATSNISVKAPSIYKMNSSDSSVLCSEIQVLIPQCNGQEYWLITTLFDTTGYTHSNKFIVFSVGLNGITHHHTSDLKTNYGNLGQLKASPNGLYIAYPGGILSFNNNTGIPSLFRTLPYTNFATGISFSPDSKLLYVVEGDNDNGTDDELAQYDLMSTTSDLNRTVIASDRFNQIQLAPDDKIYLTNNKNYNSLSVINKPNNLSNTFQSNATGYEQDVVALSVNGIGGTHTSTLPNMIDAKKPDLVEREIIVRIKNCDSVFFNNTDKCTHDHLWNFGDGTTSTSEMPSHYYDSVANYLVTYTNNNGTDSIWVNLIQEEPNFDGDTIICDTINPQYYTITNPDSTMDYSWGSGGNVTFEYNGIINQGIGLWKGNGSLTLTATSKRTGCMSDKYKTFTMNPVENNEISALCEGLKVITLKGETPTNIDTNTIAYQWQINTDTTWADTAWKDISGADTKNYSLNNTSKARYRRKVITGQCENASNYIIINYYLDVPEISGVGISSCDTGQLYTYSTIPNDTNFIFSWSVFGGTIQSGNTNDTTEIKWNNIGKTNVLVTDTFTGCYAYSKWKMNEFIGSALLTPDTLNMCVASDSGLIHSLKACIPSFYWIENTFERQLANGTWATVISYTDSNTAYKLNPSSYITGFSTDSTYKIRRVRYYKDYLNPSLPEYYDTSNVVIVNGNIFNNIINPKVQYTCLGATTDTLKGELPSNIPSGTYTYQWQLADHYLNFSNISGATAKNHLPASLSDTLVYYRRKITSSLCAKYSDTVQVKAISNVIQAGTGPYKIGCVYYVMGNKANNGRYQWQYSNDAVNWFNFGSGDTLQDLSFKSKITDIRLRRLIITPACTSISNVILKQDALSFNYVLSYVSTCDKANDSVHFEMSMSNAESFFTNYRAYLQGYQFGIWSNIDDEFIDTSNDYTYSKTVVFNTSLYSKYRFMVKGACDSSLYYSTDITTQNCGTTTSSTFIYEDNNVYEGDSAMFIVSRPCGNTGLRHWLVSYSGTFNDTLQSTNSDTLIIHNVAKCMDGINIKFAGKNRCGNNDNSTSVNMNVNHVLNSDLYVKDASNDTGQISTKELNIWHSPDIWVTRVNHSSLVQEQMVYDTLNPHKVHVRVRNKGTSTSLPSRLKIYWTYGALNERWPLRWTENTSNSFVKCGSSPSQSSYYGGEITKDTVLEIPPMSGNSEQIFTIDWFPPNPYWFCKFVNSIFQHESESSICFLARIEDCDLKPYGMQTVETDSLKYNVVWNNNIATRNLSVQNLNNIRKSTQVMWVGVGNQPGNTDPITLVFKKRSGFDYNSYGEVYLTLDDNLLEKWQAGGNVGSGYISESNGVFLLNTDEDFVLGNLNLENEVENGYHIGVEFNVTSEDISEYIVWDFVLYQYQYSSLVTIDNETVPQGGMNFTVDYSPDGYDDFVMQKEGIKEGKINTPDASMKKNPEQDNTINIQSRISGVSVYPNPANNEITIAGENMNNIKIYDGLGKQLMNMTPKGNKQKLYVGDIAQSVILVEVTQNDGSISKHKVVILH